MAIIANTFVSYSARGNRESLENVIYNIAPTDTPLMSMLPKVPVPSVRHDWQTDTLANAANNAVVEGDDLGTSITATTATVRLQNFCQISRKDFGISGTQEVVNKAGRKSEMAYQAELKTKELKRDIEFALSQNNASVAGAAATARQSASMESWLTTNDSRGAGGADGGFNSGTGLVAAPTDGTARTFTEALLQTVIRNCWTAGGNPDTVLCSADKKQAISAFGGNGTRFIKAESGVLNTAFDVYVSDFGKLKIVPSRFNRARTVLVIDSTMAAFGTFRPFQIKDLATTGDYERKMVICEWMLVCRNEAAHGVIADLT